MEDAELYVGRKRKRFDERDERDVHDDACTLLAFPHGVEEPEGFGALVTRGDAEIVQRELDVLVRALRMRRDAREAIGDDAVAAAQKTLHAEREALRRELERAKEDASSHAQARIDTARAEVERTEAELRKQRRENERDAEMLRDAQRTIERLRGELLHTVTPHAKRLIEERDEERAALRREIADKDAEIERVRRAAEYAAQEGRLQAGSEALELKERLLRAEAQCVLLTTAVSPHAQAQIDAAVAAAKEKEGELAETRKTLEASQRQVAMLIERTPVERAPTASNVEAGRAGEQIARDLVRAAFNGGRPDSERFAIADVSHDTTYASCGDLEIRKNGYAIRVEVKNYRDPVPATELDKFKEQLTRRSDVAVGVFLSLHSTVYRHDAEYHDEVLPNGCRLMALMNVCAANTHQRMRQLAAAADAHGEHWIAHHACTDERRMYAWRHAALAAKKEVVDALINAQRKAEAQRAIKRKEVQALDAEIAAIKIAVQGKQRELDAAATRIEAADQEQDQDARANDAHATEPHATEARTVAPLRGYAAVKEWFHAAWHHDTAKNDDEAAARSTEELYDDFLASGRIMTKDTWFTHMKRLVDDVGLLRADARVNKHCWKGLLRKHALLEGR